MNRDPLQLASEIFSLIEDAAPERQTDLPADIPPLIRRWSDLKPPLVALGAADPSHSVRLAADALRKSGNAFFDLLAKGSKGMKPGDAEVFLSDLPNRHATAMAAADALLRAVA